MRWNGALILSVALVCLAAMTIAQAQWDPNKDPLGTGTWDRIASTEHTPEYLAKTGGVAQPDLYGYPYWNAAGNWTFELRDQRSKPVGNIDLQLFQMGNILFGRGAFSEGLRQQPATAEGALMEGNSMTLNVVSLDDVNLYRLSINIGNRNTTSGSFIIFTPAGSTPVQGSIYGGRNEPRTFSPLDIMPQSQA